jgi:hypothetical protein
MSLNTLLPFLSTAVMATFVIFVLRRYVARRKLHFLFWGIGLAMFGAGSFAEAFLAVTWNRWVFFSWYFFGAALNAAFIGHGTVYLLFRKKRVHVLTGILVAGSLVALVLMMQAMADLDTAAFTTAEPISETYRSIMPDVQRLSSCSPSPTKRGSRAGSGNRSSGGLNRTPVHT